jgi:hypothetical protein
MAQRPTHNTSPTGVVQPRKTNADLDETFGKAKRSFLATLTPQERTQFASCKSADELLSDFEPIAQKPHFKRTLPFMRRIKNFSDCLEPYFKVVEIVCQSNPEWTCVAWGAFRLVLQVRNPP